MYLRPQEFGVATDARKQPAAPLTPPACPDPLLAPVGVPLREYIRCLQRRLAASRTPADTHRIRCDLVRARQRLVLEPAPTPVQPSSSPVASTTVSPFRFVCRVHAQTQEGGHSWGTGFLIHPRIVLSAAHVVFPPQTRSRTVSVTVTPGQDGDATPLGGPFRAKAWLAAPGWNASAPCEHDFAVIVLPNSTAAGFWPIHPVSAADVLGVDVYHAGYPLCRAGDPGTKMVRGIGQILGALQYRAGCSLLAKRSPVIVAISGATRTVGHNIPACLRQSGGPLWVLDLCTRKPVVVAIHQAASENRRVRSAIFLSAAVVGEIRALMQSLLK
jgi:hypothetical protein